MSRSLYPIDVMATDMAEKFGDTNGRYFLGVKKEILRAYKKVTMMLGVRAPTIKTLVFDTDESICMPDDFIKETKVGLRRNGKVAILSLAQNVTSEDFRTLKNMTQTQSVQTLSDIFNDLVSRDTYYSFFNCFYNGEDLGELQGMGFGVNTMGFYAIDEHGTIDIGSLVEEGDQIVIEYRSTGLGEGLELIPVDWEEPIRQLTRQYWYEDKNPNLSQMAESKFEKEYNQLAKRISRKAASYYDWIFAKQQVEGQI